MTFSCPACGGPTSELSGGRPHRYRCRIGHTYTVKTLLADQDEAVEHALEVALRTLEERSRMLARMGRDEREGKRNRSAEQFEERAEETKEQAESIRRLLQEGD